MAYISKSDVTSIREALKMRFPKVKFSVSSPNGNCVNVAIMKSATDFTSILDSNGNADINQYYCDERHYGVHATFFQEVIDIIKTAPASPWYNNSNVQSDYFDIAYYFSVAIGKWNIPYMMK